MIVSIGLEVNVDEQCEGLNSPGLWTVVEYKVSIGTTEEYREWFKTIVEFLIK